MDHGIHPLLIDLVLTNIFHRLSSIDLKRCRLVCNHWSEIGHGILLSKSRNAIIFGDSNRQHNLQSFFTVLKSGAKLPFTTFTIQPSIFSNQRSQTIQDFFVTTASYLKSLTIIYVDHSHYYTLPKIEFLCGNNVLAFPYLTHFRFEVLPFNQFSLSGPVLTKSTLNGVDLFRNIFQVVKNLIRLELVIPKSLALAIEPYLRVISEGDSCSYSRFTELILNLSLSDETIDILQRVRFPFKTVRISQKGSECRIRSPIDFIGGHASSLQHLKTDCLNFQAYPQLISLETLEILDSIQSTNEILHGSQSQQFENLKFPKVFPSLRKIIFASYPWQDAYLKLFPTSPTRTVRELKLPKHIQIQSTNLVSRISSSFPMLVQLEIFLTHETISCLSEIFKKLSQLEELSVTFFNWRESKCMDYILTGIEEDVRNPSILDLKYLRKLQLRNMTKYGINRPRITDISIHYGLIPHPTLSILCIWPSVMSGEGIHELRQRFKLTLMPF